MPHGSTAEEVTRAFGAVRTERLLLRQPAASDGHAVLRIEGDPETNRYNPRPYTREESDAALAEWLREWHTYGVGYWVVTLATDQQVIGVGGARHISWHECDVLNLYYRFTPSAWGQGYATEMARTAVDLARRHLPSLPLIAKIRAVNTPSQRVAERAGLERRPDLDTEDHLIYALGWGR